MIEEFRKINDLYPYSRGLISDLGFKKKKDRWILELSNFSELKTVIKVKKNDKRRNN